MICNIFNNCLSCVHVEGRGSQQQVTPSVTVHLTFCHRVSHWIWSSLIWSAIELRGSVSASPALRFRGGAPVPGYCVGTGNPAPCFCAQAALYWLCHLFSTWSTIFKKPPRGWRGGSVVKAWLFFRRTHMAAHKQTPVLEFPFFWPLWGPAHVHAGKKNTPIVKVNKSLRIKKFRTQ